MFSFSPIIFIMNIFLTFNIVSVCVGVCGGMCERDKQ